MIRIAAVGDVHVDRDTQGRFRPAMERVDEHADVLLLAGDLSNHGTLAEARAVVEEFRDLPVPVIGVLGNHDHHDDRPEEFADVLREGGLQILEGNTTVVSVGQERLGVAGVKGFGGGFAGRCGSSFGEREMKAFIDHSRQLADSLEHALHALDADQRVALTHYSPVPDTVRGEPPEIHPFLGTHMLAGAIDAAAVDLAVHGHAHYGTERGTTPGGVPVRNVAQPVLGEPFAKYRLGTADSIDTTEPVDASP
ncbi:Icc-related predicted phosphoesterase [Halopolyspora algeriensis]|uniref:Icc-related predicted phosphoesterase n=1 Tax=Halopolyspora algeriensis TaxID=1500506 RepID=A0A368VWV7_9ACTN|nr:metallophosphoesterase [Halopolyspora algeriensis]RCW44637.1 Icc-related predicted phosphoesterase [Halopolyspora algeriensis]TQM55998.1 Icc-related predicted phosphoesterase [Halopolyspora algeriensis]